MTIRMTTNRTIIYETPSSSCSDPSSFAAERLGKTIAHCVVLVISLVGNCFIGIIVYKTRTMRKTINYFIANMAVSDLLYPISVFPRNLVQLSVDSWLIDGPLGQALRKLLPFLQYVSAAVSIQSLVLIAVDRFGAVVCPLRPPIISSKLSFFFYTFYLHFRPFYSISSYLGLQSCSLPRKLVCQTGAADSKFHRIDITF